MGSFLNFQQPPLPPQQQQQQQQQTNSEENVPSNEEELHHVQELAKELSGFKTLPVDEIRTSHKKPQYTSDGSSIGYGSVLIENIKVYDRLSHTEMADIIEMMSNAKKILYNPCSVRQTKEGELQKRKLLSLLGQLNWGVKDYTLQARLLKPMEDRLNSSIFLQKLNVTHE